MKLLWEELLDFSKFSKMSRRYANSDTESGEEKEDLIIDEEDRIYLGSLTEIER